MTEPYVAGVLGDVVLVNGAPWPIHDVSATRHRLRILNGSNARHPRVAGGFVQIGSDHGLLDAPRAHGSVRIAPAKRYDIVVDFGRYPVGSEITLVNRLGTGSTAHVMRFRIARHAGEDSAIPTRLSHLEPLQRGQATVTREFSSSIATTPSTRTWQ